VRLVDLGQVTHAVDARCKEAGIAQSLEYAVSWRRYADLTRIF
jgi:hypothetical protein